MKLIALGSLCFWIFAGCGMVTAGPSTAAVFKAMLSNATLSGTWAPMAHGAIGSDKQDGYHIVRADQLEGKNWRVVSRVKYQGKMVDFPIPVEMHFAHDAAVMVLTNVPIGDGGTWSARIMFHDDTYSGHWWSPDQTKTGFVSGTITRVAK